MKTLKLTFVTKITVAALVLASAGTSMFCTGNAYATPYGTEITKNDGISNGNGLGTLKEDNEEEPNMVQSQAWDLEGFFLSGKKLSIVGGYNFYTGKSDGNKTLTAGDIFVDTNGDAVYSPNTIPGYNYAPGYNTVSNKDFKYDYVLHINWSAGSFVIVKLDDLSSLENTEYGAAYNTPSNPWKYISGGTEIYSSSFDTYNKSSQSDTGFNGWSGDGASLHYVATFDITSIDLSKGALFHNTMECGNDNLLGQIAPVPEPGTMMLLGFGMLGLAVYGKRRMNKDA